MNILTNIETQLSQLVGDNFPQKKYLLAISGGVDSMVLLDAFKQLNLKFEVAHCNYKLRAEDSDLDEKLVKDICEANNIKAHFKSFDTTSILKKEGGSIQETARNLRYTWFNQLLLGFDYLVTAHHLNDNIETFFINLSRGSGLKGLSGIPQQNDKIIRPMLKLSKKEILAYAQENNITWREDASNKTDKYVRNMYRNQVLPIIKETKPQFEAVMDANLERLNQTKRLLNFFIEEVKNKVVKKVEGQTKIALEKLKTYPSKEVILYEILHQFGFNYDQAKDMLNVAESGKIFLSETFKAVVDRGELLIFKNQSNKQIYHQFNSIEELKKCSNFLSVEEVDVPENIQTSIDIVFIDVEAVKFPLTLRTWKNGDTFRPLGMRGNKKVSDFLIDSKIPLHEKDNVLILESEQNPLWIVGYRIDDRCKITSKTKRILKLVTK